MKKIIALIKKIITFIIRLILSFFSSPYETKKKIKKVNESPKNFKIIKEKKEEKEDDESTNEGFLKELSIFKNEKEYEEIFQKLIEEIFYIKIENLSIKEKEELKKYEEKLKKQIKNEQISEDKQVSFLTEKIKEVKKTYQKKETKENQEKELPKKENQEPQIFVEKKEEKIIQTETKVEIEKEVLKEEKQLEKKEQEIILNEKILEEPKIKIEKEPVKQERKEPLKKEEKTNDFEKEHKEPAYEKINPKKLEEETKHIIKIATEEIEKEEVREKDYEKVESLLKEKIENLENLLTLSLKEEEKIELQKEIEKRKNYQNKINFYKQEELEQIRVSLEEEIEPIKIDNIKKEFEKIELSWNLEYQNHCLNKKNKTEEEIRNMEKNFIKEKFRLSCQNIEFPFLFSIPFIKNKYIKMFLTGILLFTNFNFIKRMLLKEQEIEKINFINIKNGRDAFLKSSNLLKNNIETFIKLKELTFIKYPELIKDQELLVYINTIETTLMEKLEEVKKEEQMLKKYFPKKNILVRKLERKI